MVKTVYQRNTAITTCILPSGYVCAERFLSPWQSEVNAAQFPIQVQTDPSTYPIMYPGGPVAPLAPVPLAPLAPMPVPSPEAPAQSRAEPAAQSDAGDPRLQPMPKDCQDYSSPECQVFLDWPTGEVNPIGHGFASLRAGSRWPRVPNGKRKPASRLRPYRIGGRIRDKTNVRMLLQTSTTKSKRRCDFGKTGMMIITTRKAGDIKCSRRR